MSHHEAHQWLSLHQPADFSGRLLHTDLVVHDLPVQGGDLDQLPEVGSGTLLDEFDVGGVAVLVLEGDDHEVQEVDDLALEFEDLGGCLDLTLESVSGGAEPEGVRCVRDGNSPGRRAAQNLHHESTRETKDEILSLKQGGDVHWRERKS